MDAMSSHLQAPQIVCPEELFRITRDSIAFSALLYPACTRSVRLFFSLKTRRKSRVATLIPGYTYAENALTFRVRHKKSWLGNRGYDLPNEKRYVISTEESTYRLEVVTN